MIAGMFGGKMERHFGVPVISTLLLSGDAGRQLALTRVLSPSGLEGPTNRVPPEKAFSISVHLRRPGFVEGWGSWTGGRFRAVRFWDLGGMEIFNLQADPIALRRTGFETVHIHVPQQTIDSYFNSCDELPVNDLQCTAGQRDNIIYRWVTMLLPLFGDKQQLPSLAIDEAVLMFCSYTFNRYGTQPSPRSVIGGLANWQQRRATRLIAENLHGDVSLASLASACGLSPNHFARAFKRSFGIPAHKYLIQRRVEKAKALIQHSDVPLIQVALECGFPDQPAFNRSFRAVVGTTPGVWRRHNRTPATSIFWSAPSAPPNRQPALP